MRSYIKYTLFLLCFLILCAPISLYPCTSFCIVKDGYGIFGANLDFNFQSGLIFINRKNIKKKSFEPGNTGRNIEWVVKYGSVTFNLVGLEYTWGGMNEAGLMVSSMSLGQTKTAKSDHRPTLDTGIWLQYLLDNCATIEQVVETDKMVRVRTPDHYLVSDRHGNCAVIEFLRGKMVVHKGNNITIRTLANDPYKVASRVWHKNEGRIIPRKYKTRNDHSMRRFCTAANAVKGYSTLKHPDVLTYSFDVLNKVATKAIIWSLVFDPKNKKVYWQTHKGSEIGCIDLNKIDFSCQSKMKMMDPFIPLTGDMTDRFITYNHVMQVEHFYSFCIRYGLKPTREGIEKLTIFFEGFTCK